MNHFKTILIVFLYLLFASCENSDINKKIVFVDNQKVFKEFKMTKELTQLMNTKTQDYNIYLDSLNLVLDSKSTLLKLGDSSSVANYLEFKKFVEAQKTLILEQNQTENQMYNDQIMNQLNAYIGEFGKSKNISVILGANGQGSLLYADEGIDVTSEVIEYINNKYEGN